MNITDLRRTYTMALMEVPASAHAFIQRALHEAGYGHAIEVSDGQTVLDMHGIGLVTSAGSTEEPTEAALLAAWYAFAQPRPAGLEHIPFPAPDLRDINDEQFMAGLKRILITDRQRVALGLR